ncbi:MAG: alanyl-tRNA editing protein [Erysipelotrichaceae bacterium]|nr:alanyl-tRNA editing protein [Erysipelotrichaceae bacterium]
MEEMNELFYRDSYTRSFTAAVTECFPYKEKWAVVLEDTAFYPEGGGQPGDHGTLNGITVTDTLKKEGKILHLCEQPLPVGETVQGELDWDYRFCNMQSHSGEHLFSGLVYKHFGYENIGFHMGKEVTTLDFSGPFSAEDARRLEEEANERIQQDLPLSVSFPGPEELSLLHYRSKKELSGKVRIVTIPDCDVCACCGTHVSSLGQIGILKVLSCVPHKGGARVEILAGKRAYQWIAAICSVNKDTALLFKGKETETAKDARRILNESHQKDIRRGELLRRYFSLIVQETAAADPLILGERDLDSEELRLLGNMLVESGKTKTAVLYSLKENGGNYLAVSEERDLRPLAKELNSRISGRGGGSKEMIRGSFQADEETVIKAAREVFYGTD